MAPTPQAYDVLDVLGNRYVWQGADGDGIQGVFTWSDNVQDTDLCMLKCDGDVFVNASQVVSLTPRVQTQPV